MKTAPLYFSEYPLYLRLHALFDENIPDIHLGDENGLDLLKEIKERYKDIRVIMVGYVRKPLKQHIIIALE